MIIKKMSKFTTVSASERLMKSMEVAIDNMIEEYKAFMDNAINASSDGFVTESGEVEKWVGGVNKERAEKAMEETVKYLKSLKKE